MSSYYRLDNISAIKAIDAVGPHNAFLNRQNINFLELIINDKRSTFNFGEEKENYS